MFLNISILSRTSKIWFEKTNCFKLTDVVQQWKWTAHCTSHTKRTGVQYVTQSEILNDGYVQQIVPSNEKNKISCKKNQLTKITRSDGEQ